MVTDARWHRHFVGARSRAIKATGLRPNFIALRLAAARTRPVASPIATEVAPTNAREFTANRSAAGSGSASSLLAQLLAATAVLAAPAYAQSDAALGTSVSYRHSDYDEDALESAPVDGSDRRYRVRSEQFQLATSIGESDRLGVDLTYESMSGSSPWFSVPDADGNALQVMSGATIRETRHELRAAWSRDRGDAGSIGASASYSTEDDYRASALGVDWQRPLSAAIDLGLGLSWSHDTLDPTDAAEFGRIDHASKDTGSAYASLTFVLDRSSQLQTGLQWTRADGYLSDPYKRFFAGDQVLPDARPGTRNQTALLLRYRRAFVDQDGALHLDYRFAGDTWGVRSHALEASWYQMLPHEFRLVPGLRWYSQGAADFYAPFSAPGEAGRHHSSDYRLAANGSIAASLDLRRRSGAFEWVVSVENLSARDALGFSGEEDPGRVSYLQIMAGFDYHFE